MSILNKLAQLVFGFKKSDDIQHLTFEKQNNRWYIVLPHWPGTHDNLQMVGGADKLLEYYSQGKDHVSLDVSTKSEDNETCDLSLFSFDNVDDGDGMTYILPSNHPSGLDSIWLCPVTCFVFGQFPQFINLSNIHSF